MSLLNEELYTWNTVTDVSSIKKIKSSVDQCEGHKFNSDICYWHMSPSINKVAILFNLFFSIL